MHTSLLGLFWTVFGPTWFVVRLVFILRVGEGEGWVLSAGHSWAAAGLYPSPFSPQLDGSLGGQRPLRVRVGIGACAERVAPLEEAEVGAVGNGSGVRRWSRLAYSELGQGEVPPCGGEKAELQRWCVGSYLSKAVNGSIHINKCLLAYLANKPTITHREAH